MLGFLTFGGLSSREKLRGGALGVMTREVAGSTPASRTAALRATARSVATNVEVAQGLGSQNLTVTGRVVVQLHASTPGEVAQWLEHRAPLRCLEVGGSSLPFPTTCTEWS